MQHRDKKIVLTNTQTSDVIINFLDKSITFPELKAGEYEIALRSKDEQQTVFFIRLEENKQ